MQFNFGTGVMFAVRKDINGATPVQFGAMQDVQVSFSGDTKMLYSQSSYPIDVARGKVKIECKAKVAQVSAALFNTIFWGGTLSAGQTLISYQESKTVPSTTPYTIASTNASAFLDDLGVKYQTQTNGSNTGPLTLGTPTSTAGTYAVGGGGTYTFASGDANAAVYLNYSYTVTTGMTVAGGNPFMGNTPYFTAEFSDTFEGGNVTLKLYRCVGKTLSIPTKLDDYAIQDFDFDAFADASGNTFIFTTT